jgi:hypothetical protein
MVGHGGRKILEAGHAIGSESATRDLEALRTRPSRIFAERILWGPHDDSAFPDDVGALLSSGTGRLTIDMISGERQRNGQGIEDLWIAKELKGWLARQLQKQNDPPSDIAAVMEVKFAIDEKHHPHATLSVRWAIDCTATITSDGKSYTDTYST